MQHGAIHHRGSTQAIQDAGRGRALPRRRLLAVACLVPAAGPALAQGDQWTVRGVVVDVSGPDAVAARDRALAEATRRAWDELLTRIASPDRAAPLRTLPVPEIELLTDGVEIDDEAVAPNRYRATLSVSFNAGRVRTRLAGAAGGERGGPIEVLARFRGVGQWADLRRRLDGSVAVARVELKALRATEAELALLLTAEPQEAAGMLATAGVRLEPGPAGGTWLVRLATP